MKTPGAMSSPREEERMEGAAALWSWDGGSQPPTHSQQEEAEPCHFQKGGGYSGESQDNWQGWGMWGSSPSLCPGTAGG